MKTCPKCNETKALQMFGKNKSRKVNNAPI